MNAIIRSAVAQELPDGEWDPYRILGLSRRASAKSIRSAYRRLAKQLHSDISGDAAAFLLLKEAHDFLLDPVSRSLWDRRQIRATDQLRTISIKMLEGLFESVVNQVVESSLPPEHQHIPDLVKKVIRGNMEDLARAEGSHRRKLARLKLMMGKVRRSDAGKNLAAVVLDRKLAETESVIQKITQEIEVGDVMLAELEAYSSDAPCDEFYSGSSRRSASAEPAFTIRLW